MGRFLKHELSGWKAWEIIWLAAACTVITALSLHWGDDALGITMALTGVLCVILTGKGKMSCYLDCIWGQILRRSHAECLLLCPYAVCGMVHVEKTHGR